MIDVFFRGSGAWKETKTGALAFPESVGCYFAGVFRLSEYDERIYRHLGKIECCGALFPATGHPDDAFCRFPGFLRSVFSFGDAEKFEGFSPKDVYFEVDINEPYEIALTQAVGPMGLKSPNSKPGNNERVAYILQVCRDLAINPLQVPYGKKGGIEKECLKNNELFKNKSAFNHGWEHGNGCGAIEVQDKRKYLRKQ
jgi:hypothetical protein